MWFEVRDGLFHDGGGLEDEGELPFSGAEEFADSFHSGEEMIVDDLQWCVCLERFVEVGCEVLVVAVDDVELELFFECACGFFACGFGLVDVGEELDEVLEWVEGFRASVVDEVERCLSLVQVDLVERDDLGCVEDPGGHADLFEFVKEDGVENDACGGFETEGAVGEPAGEVDIGERVGDAFGALDEFEGAASIGFEACGDGEDEGVDEEVGLVEFVDLGGAFDGTLRDLELAVGGAGHCFFGVFVDCSDDECGAVGFGECADLVELVFAVLEVCGVDDATPGGALEARFEGLGGCRIEHQRRVDVLVES